MSNTSLRSRILSVSLCLLFGLVPCLGAAQTAPPTNVVISQVYGGGGNSGATITNDFIELFNPTSTTVTLTGYSIQYASATSSSVYQVAALPSTITLAPGEYFLIQAAVGAGDAKHENTRQQNESDDP